MFKTTRKKLFHVRAQKKSTLCESFADSLSKKYIYPCYSSNNDSERIVSASLTSFADPFKVRLRLPVDHLLLANFEEVSPVFDAFAFLGEFSETSTQSSVIRASFKY